MKICIRENYIDKTALTRFSETELIKQPYNFSFVECEKEDCEYCDFDFVNNSYVFNETKYNYRKIKETNEPKIAELKEYLNTTWRWKNERHNAELEEIKLGIRETTTQTTEEIIFDRKEKVDEINSLES